MRMFLKKISVFSMPFIFFLCFAIIGDPFNVFHYRSIRDNGIDPNKNYIKTRYLLEKPGLFDSYLFGSSRVGVINVVNIPELRCYNMTSHGGIPSDHYQTLNVLIQKNLIPDTVLVGIDDIVCYTKPEEQYADLMRIPYPVEALENSGAYFWFLARYIDLKIVPSIPIMVNHVLGGGGDSIRFRKYFYENGGYTTHYTVNFEQKKDYWETAATGGSLPFHYGVTNALQDIQAIIDLCREHNIKLILFTNPIHRLTYQQAVEYGYLDFLSQLAEITDYYNFSGLNDITVNNDNYFETSHYRHNVGDLIVDTIFNGKTGTELLSQGFGRYVTSETKAEFLDLLNSQLRGF